MTFMIIKSNQQPDIQSPITEPHPPVPYLEIPTQSFVNNHSSGTHKGIAALF